MRAGAKSDFCLTQRKDEPMERLFRPLSRMARKFRHAPRHRTTFRPTHPRSRRGHGHHDPASRARRRRTSGETALLSTPLPSKATTTCLALTRPDILRGIHDAYFEAGADIAETNTFSSTTIAQADYGLESAVWDLNCRLCRNARHLPMLGPHKHRTTALCSRDQWAHQPHRQHQP